MRTHIVRCSFTLFSNCLTRSIITTSKKLIFTGPCDKQQETLVFRISTGESGLMLVPLFLIVRILAEYNKALQNGSEGEVCGVVSQGVHNYCQSEPWVHMNHCETRVCEKRGKTVQTFPGKKSCLIKLMILCQSHKYACFYASSAKACSDCHLYRHPKECCVSPNQPHNKEVRFYSTWYDRIHSSVASSALSPYAKRTGVLWVWNPVMVLGFPA